MVRRIQTAIVGVCLLAMPLGGCIVDQYGSRAVAYNIEAEQAQNQALLLNIVRAYKRYPMEFTSLGAVIAGSSASTSATLGVPFGHHLSSSDMLSVNPSMSAGITSFQVTPLDNADFYNGILTPIQPGTFDLYLQAGYPREVLFDLFVDKIVIRREDGACALDHSPRCETTFRNYVGSDHDFDLFQGMVDHLLRLGLTTSQTPTVTSTGRKKQDSTKKDDKKDGKKDDKKDDDKDEKKDSMALRYSFCFAPNELRHGESIDPLAICRLPFAPTSPIPLRGVIFSPEFVARLNSLQGPSEHQQRFETFIGRRVWIFIYARPIQRIIYYIGEVVRRQIDPEYGSLPRSVKIKLGPAHVPIPEDPCPRSGPDVSIPLRDGYYCVDLFVLNAETAGPSTLSIDYGGARYSVPANRDYAGYSYSVLALARQLLATSTTDKAAPPATTILTVSPTR